MRHDKVTTVHATTAPPEPSQAEIEHVRRYMDGELCDSCWAELSLEERQSDWTIFWRNKGSEGPYQACFKCYDDKLELTDFGQ